MTDNEIIKALECCISTDNINPKCEDCPYDGDDLLRPCNHNLMKDAIDLINRQQAEIENMNNLVVYNATCATKLQLKLVEAKAEAIKEFAERLKSRLITVTYMNFDDTIDNLVKEMVGDTE